ncbi:hypothetical protein EBME_2156 [bacterium endosymbiont of Mortierella elongata FMR23-6]|nr:hypothetical protein EBME_2156 [bacterium endosymbiont of Mortierella elongata FMR23-6]
MHTLCRELLPLVSFGIMPLLRNEVPFDASGCHHPQSISARKG